MNHSTPGLPVHHQLLESTQTHVCWVGDAIQPSHPLSSPSPALNPSQHQDLFKWVNSSHQVAKVLEFQLQHQTQPKLRLKPESTVWDSNSLSFFLNLFFNWRIIGLQCCVGSCHTTWISNKSTYFPSLVALPLILHSIPHPSRLSQSAVLSSVYYTAASRQLSILPYGHVYVSMLFSQFVPHSPSLAVSTSLFSVSASGTHCLLIKITYWSSGSLCLSAEGIQWETKW